MQRRNCLSGLQVSTADNVVTDKVESDDGPVRKRRKLSALITSPKAPPPVSVYASQHEPRPCNSHQSASLIPCQSAALPPSTHSAAASQHVLRTRRSSPAILQRDNSLSSSPAEILRRRSLNSTSSGRHEASRSSLLTRSRSDVSRDGLVAPPGGVNHQQLSSLNIHEHPAAAYLSNSSQSNSYFTTPHPYQPVVSPAQSTYFTLPYPPTGPPPLTAALPTAPVSTSIPYLAATTMRPSVAPWPGMSVVPAAVLAADVFPEYYYALSHDTSAYQPAAAFHHYQHDEIPLPYQYPLPVTHHQQPMTADHASYSEHRQIVNADTASPLLHPTQLAHNMTQISHHAPLMYTSDLHAATERRDQRAAELEAFTQQAAETRDWSALSRSSEHVQPLFVHHFLSMLESTLGAVRSSPAPHFRNYEALLGLARQLSESKPKGLSKADIDRLASFQFTSASANHVSDEALKQAVTQTSCVVCMSEFVNRQRIRELPCQHIFHLKCIDKWLKTNRTCPLCRADVLSLLNSDTKQFID